MTVREDGETRERTKTSEGYGPFVRHCHHDRLNGAKLFLLRHRHGPASWAPEHKSLSSSARRSTLSSCSFHIQRLIIISLYLAGHIDNNPAYLESVPLLRVVDIDVFATAQSESVSPSLSHNGMARVERTYDVGRVRP